MIETKQHLSVQSYLSSIIERESLPGKRQDGSGALALPSGAPSLEEPVVWQLPIELACADGPAGVCSNVDLFNLGPT